MVAVTIQVAKVNLDSLSEEVRARICQEIVEYMGSLLQKSEKISCDWSELDKKDDHRILLLRISKGLARGESFLEFAQMNLAMKVDRLIHRLPEFNFVIRICVQFSDVQAWPDYTIRVIRETS